MTLGKRQLPKELIGCGRVSAAGDTGGNGSNGYCSSYTVGGTSASLDRIGLFDFGQHLKAGVTLAHHSAVLSVSFQPRWLGWGQLCQQSM